MLQQPVAGAAAVLGLGSFCKSARSFTTNRRISGCRQDKAKDMDMDMDMGMDVDVDVDVDVERMAAVLWLAAAEMREHKAVVKSHSKVEIVEAEGRKKV